MNEIGGVPLFFLEFGDIVAYFSPFTLTLFLLALVFSVFVIVSRPERQIDIAFGADAFFAKEISLPELRFRQEPGKVSVGGERALQQALCRLGHRLRLRLGPAHAAPPSSPRAAYPMAAGRNR